MTVFDACAIFVAAFAAGSVNAIAGGGTLISFPVLVWIGRDPIIANATNAVALWPGSLASAFGYRREIEGSGRLFLWFGAPSLVGGALGAALLLQTPGSTFKVIVPYLILFATLVFAAQQRLAASIAGRIRTGVESDGVSKRPAMAALLFQMLISVYGGYFGAGMGIVMLAGLGFLGMSDVHRANGLKNFCAFLINGVASVLFVRGDAVNWLDAGVMALGAVVGGYAGAGLGRRLGRTFVQRAVVLVGILAAASMLVVLRH